MLSKLFTSSGLYVCSVFHNCIRIVQVRLLDHGAILLEYILNIFEKQIKKHLFYLILEDMSLILKLLWVADEINPEYFVASHLIILNIFLFEKQNMWLTCFFLIRQQTHPLRFYFNLFQTNNVQLGYQKAHLFTDMKVVDGQANIESCIYIVYRNIIWSFNLLPDLSERARQRKGEKETEREKIRTVLTARWN